MATTKISITVQDDLLAEMDLKRGILNRSMYINLAIQAYNQAKDAVR